MKKKFLLFMVLSLAIMASIPVFGNTAQKVAGVYYHTDIQAYLCGTPIQGVNIGGKTLIDAEAMARYGFKNFLDYDANVFGIICDKDVVSDTAMQVALERKEKGKVGTVAGTYSYAEMKTTLDGKDIDSYMVYGRPFISAEDMGKLGYQVVWDGKKRAIFIDKPSVTPSWQWYYEGGQGTTLKEGFTYEIANTTKNQQVTFDLLQAKGEYSSVGFLVFNETGVTISIYDTIENYGDFFKILINNRNFICGDRNHEDTPQRREALSQVCRVYANGKLLSGELEDSQGNGHCNYTFLYDQPLPLEGLQTLRLELGFQKP